MSAARNKARLASEGIVIVLSILLAFSIDAAWAGRQDRLEEQDALAALLADAVSNAAQVAQVMGNVHESREGALAFFEAQPSDLVAVPADGVLPLINDLTIPNRASLQVGALDRLMASGRIGIISDPSLQQLLADWPSSAARLDRRSDILVQLEVEILRGLGQHSEVHAWLMGSRSATSVDFSSVHDDAGLMASLSTVQREREIYSAVLARLEADLNALIEALEAARH